MFGEEALVKIMIICAALMPPAKAGTAWRDHDDARWGCDSNIANSSASLKLTRQKLKKTRASDMLNGLGYAADLIAICIVLAASEKGKINYDFLVIVRDGTHTLR